MRTLFLVRWCTLRFVIRSLLSSIAPPTYCPSHSSSDLSDEFQRCLSDPIMTNALFRRSASLYVTFGAFLSCSEHFLESDRSFFCAAFPRILGIVQGVYRSLTFHLVICNHRFVGSAMRIPVLSCLKVFQSSSHLSQVASQLHHGRSWQIFHATHADELESVSSAFRATFTSFGRRRHDVASCLVNRESVHLCLQLRSTQKASVSVHCRHCVASYFGLSIELFSLDRSHSAQVFPRYNSLLQRGVGWPNCFLTC